MVDESSGGSAAGWGASLNTEQILEFFSGDRDASLEIVKMAIFDVRRLWQNAQELCKQADWQRLGRTLHSLRGAISTFGFNSLQQELRRLEDICDLGRPVVLDGLSSAITDFLDYAQKRGDELEERK
ncbi:MAG: Hpt domain-containing protein [Chthoniobacterales bacterium]|nr:Hpt domain-containing protein [Chthoniobacterales bacterium]